MQRPSLAFSSSSITALIGLAAIGLFLISNAKSAEPAATLNSWPGFRGEQRNAHCAPFPDKSLEPRLLWSYTLPSQGLGGVAATPDFVVVSARSNEDKEDFFACLDPVSGAELWTFKYAATGSLDYGNSPRATPLIVDPYVFLLGAFGDFHCVNLDTGESQWKRHLVKDMAGQLPTWGYGWSPLAFDDKVIVLPGGAQNAVACLKQADGSELWKSAGQVSGYASPLVANWFDTHQVVALDKDSIAGFDLTSGKRMWTIRPPKSGDFNVPTPIVLKDSLFAVSENNGARLYKSTGLGTLGPDPIAKRDEPAPDAQSPVRVGQVVLCAEKQLTALHLDRSLEVAWTLRDRAFRNHSSLFVGGNQVLAVTQTGELLQISVDDKEARISSRYKFGPDANYILAHPAMCDSVLYLRTEHSLQAWSLWQ